MSHLQKGRLVLLAKARDAALEAGVPLDEAKAIASDQYGVTGAGRRKPRTKAAAPRKTKAKGRRRGKKKAA